MMASDVRLQPSSPFRGSTELLIRLVLGMTLFGFALVTMMLTVGRGLKSDGQIAFISSRDGDYRLYLMDVSRTLTRKLSQEAVLDCCLSWSPDGEQIGYMRRLGLNNEVFLMNLETGQSRQITRYSGGVQNVLVWSPDSQRFLVVAADGTDRGIFMLNASDAQREAFNQHMAYGLSPHWSPNGQQIAFTMGTEGQQTTVAVGKGKGTDIYVSDGEGNQARAITQRSATNLWPVWSPDGQQIAFVSISTGQVQVYITGLDGNGERQLTDSPGEKWGPLWSPDGNQIAFLNRRDGQVEIYVVDVKSGEERQLTHNDAWEWNVGWSLDGQSLIYEANPTGNFGIYLVNVAEGTDKLLTPDTNVTNSKPVWRP